jgi:hypothetical protein
MVEVRSTKTVDVIFSDCNRRQEVPELLPDELRLQPRAVPRRQRPQRLPYAVGLRLRDRGLPEINRPLGVRCYDFENIFAKKLEKKWRF